jgi:hypothetical protein
MLQPSILLSVLPTFLISVSHTLFYFALSYSLLFLFSFLPQFHTIFRTLSLLSLLMSLLFSLIFTRTSQGYLSLWTRLGEDISLNYTASPDNYFPPDTVARPCMTEYRPVTVCIGGEWYTFPSHFFLPNNARLEYVRGNFHGQLPQHFATINGTSASTAQHFNDKNEEEESRYVKLSTCDYLVATMDLHNRNSKEEEIVEKESARSGSWRDRVGQFFQTQTARGDETGDDKGESLVFSMPDTDSEPVNFRLVFSRRVIDPARSSSSLARAYIIPGLSSMQNAYNSYSALKRN